MYELVFQRMFGMILSIFIFTDIIKKGLEVLNSIYSNYIVWIYILLVIIPYIFNVYDICTILRNRISVNLIWKILNRSIDENFYLINKNVKNYLGIILISNVLNYENMLIYLICNLNTNKWIKYNSILLDYCFFIEKYSDSSFILVKNIELTKEQCNKDVLNYCEYNILLNKLRIFYFWDIEKQLGMQETLLNIKIDQGDNEININDLNMIFNDNDDCIFIYYNYNICKLLENYNDKIKNIKLDKFFNIIENKQFHEKYIHYINDNEFKKIFETIKITDIILENYIREYPLLLCNMELYNLTLEDITKKVKYNANELKQELNDWKAEWLKLNVENDLGYKYEIIFNKIEEIKKKYKTNV